MYLLGEFQSYSALSSQKPQTYPKLDIRNFYLESQRDISHDIQEREDQRRSNKADMRMFSYIAHLRNSIKKESNLVDKITLKQKMHFIDMDKFTSIIRQYCQHLKKSSRITVDDVLKIEHNIPYTEKQQLPSKSNRQEIVYSEDNSDVNDDRKSSKKNDLKNRDITNNDAVIFRDSKNDENQPDLMNNYNDPMLLQTSIVTDQSESSGEWHLHPFERPIIVPRSQYKGTNNKDNENLLHPLNFNLNLNDPNMLSEVDENGESYQTELAEENIDNDDNMIPLMHKHFKKTEKTAHDKQNLHEMKVTAHKNQNELTNRISTDKKDFINIEKVSVPIYDTKIEDIGSGENSAQTLSSSEFIEEKMLEPTKKEKLQTILSTFKDFVVGDLQISLNKTEATNGSRKIVSSPHLPSNVNETEEFDYFLFGLSDFFFDDLQSNFNKTSIQADNSEKIKSIVSSLKQFLLQDLQSSFNETDINKGGNSTLKLSSTNVEDVIQSMKEFFLVDLQSSFNKTVPKIKTINKTEITPAFKEGDFEADLLSLKEFLIGDFHITFNDSESKISSIIKTNRIEKKETVQDSLKSFKQFLFGDLQSSLTDSSDQDEDEMIHATEVPTFNSEDLSFPLLSFQGNNQKDSSTANIVKKKDKVYPQEDEGFRPLLYNHIYKSENTKESHEDGLDKPNPTEDSKVTGQKTVEITRQNDYHTETIAADSYNEYSSSSLYEHGSGFEKEIDGLSENDVHPELSSFSEESPESTSIDRNTEDFDYDSEIISGDESISSFEEEWESFLNTENEYDDAVSTNSPSETSTLEERNVFNDQTDTSDEEDEEGKEVIMSPLIYTKFADRKTIQDNHDYEDKEYKTKVEETYYTPSTFEKEWDGFLHINSKDKHFDNEISPSEGLDIHEESNAVNKTYEYYRHTISAKAVDHSNEESDADIDDIYNLLPMPLPMTHMRTENKKTVLLSEKNKPQNRDTIKNVIENSIYSKEKRDEVIKKVHMKNFDYGIEGKDFLNSSNENYQDADETNKSTVIYDLKSSNSPDLSPSNISKEFSFEVLFLEGEEVIDFNNSLSSDDKMQIKNTLLSLNADKTPDTGELKYKPIPTSSIRSPWHKKFDFFCVGNQVLMIVRKDA